VRRGVQSVTAAVKLLQRVQELQKAVAEGRPVRILYISDFDPAGDQMPVAMARQIEFWVSTYAPGADIKLTPLALTHQQCLDYDLPGAPVKETDKRGPSWKARYGDTTELDALEALHPGELERLVRAADQSNTRVGGVSVGRASVPLCSTERLMKRFDHELTIF
jgi:hypothetical protein